jgi:transcriptional regulator with XRE-family HTH domain
MAYPYTPSIKKEIGKKIRTFREKRGMLQTEVAEEAGISPAHFIRIEEGNANPTLEKIYKIVKALKIKASQILPF